MKSKINKAKEIKEDIKTYFNFKAYGKVTVDIEISEEESRHVNRLASAARKRTNEMIRYQIHKHLMDK